MIWLCKLFHWWDYSGVSDGQWHETRIYRRCGKEEWKYSWQDEMNGNNNPYRNMWK